jgi:Zn-dependent membrane protease YugP
MIFDPIYLVIIGACALLSFWASARVKGTFQKYSQVRSRSRLTGRDIAAAILRDHGIHDVKIEPVAGSLSDHYDPTSKTLRLSEPVYGQSTIAAFGVAAHEVGHAVQHATSYAPLKFRSAWVPLAGFSSQFSMWILIAAAVMGGASTSTGRTAAIIGVALFAATTIFTLITLPVEFDASRRALATLEKGGYVEMSELEGAKKVLNAAALTYVAAFVTSLATLLYWVWRLGLLGNNRD